MKNLTSIILLLILIVATSSFAKKLTPTERKALVKREFLRSFHEKTGTTPDKLQDARVFRLGSYGSKTEAPIPLAGKEVVVSKSTNPESELHAAINPADTNNIIVGAMGYGSSGSLIFPMYYTKDLGKTWKKATFTDQPVSGALRLGGGDVMYTYNVDGTMLYATWIDVAALTSFDTLFANIYFATSTNGGQNWKSSPTQTLVSRQLINSASKGEFPDKEWLTCDRSNSAYRGTIYGSYLLFTDSAVTLNVAKIKPLGTTFTDAVRVELPDITAMQIATLDVDMAGKLHITLHGTEDGEVYNIYHIVSSDGGATFSLPKKISRAEIASHSATSADYVIPGFADRQVPSVQVACGRDTFANNVYCVWDALGIDEDRGGGSDIYFSRSEDGGNTWSVPIVVNKDVSENATEQFRATISVNQRGVVSLGWYDGRESNDNTSVDYYTAFSFDGGKTFVAEQNVTTKAMDFTTVGERNSAFGIGEYMQIVSTPYLAIPIWSDARKGTGDLDIYAALVPIADQVLGVKSISNVEAGISLESVQPNPASDHVKLTISLSKDEELSVSIIDMLGISHIVPRQYQLPSGLSTIELSCADLPVGNYIIRISTPTGSVSRGITIVK